MTKKEQAVAFHTAGYNCAQSVACTFCKDMGIDEETTFKLAEALGFGIGIQHACGAVTGMAMVTGMKISNGKIEEVLSKHECYEKMEQLIKEFTDKHGSIICTELRKDANDDPTYCNRYIETAIDIIENFL